MQRQRTVVALAVLAFVLVALSGCGSSSGPDPDPVGAAFAALQDRGQEAMGVDQYTSTHLFDALPDGGRIELQRDVDDPEGIATIRRHLQEVQAAFSAGDFGTPAFVHAREVPGTAVLAARSDRIQYLYRELPRGGELRLVTDDPEAIAAIRDFIAFQRHDHRSGGTDHSAMDHATMHGGR